MPKDKRLIPINITEGKVSAIHIEANDKVPDVYAKVSLIDEYGNRISYITVGTGRWNDVNDMELTPRAAALIGELIEELKTCAVRHMNRSRKIIGGEKT